MNTMPSADVPTMRLRSRTSGTTGSGARISTRTNTVRSAMPMSSIATIGAEVQASSWPPGDTLECTRRDELVEVLGLCAQRGGHHKANAAADQQRLAAELVRELAGDRHEHSAGDQIGRGDPGVVLEAAELGGDARQSSG